MCGFAGYITAEKTQFQNSLTQMLDAIRRRGPDAGDTWADTEAGVFLGHRRLAIIDLSDDSKQPISSRSGNLVMVCNGEIYNFKDIGRELNLPEIDLKSDMRVLVNAVEIWGLEKTLDRVRGMFAFAIFDRQNRQLMIARDPVGEKPLYYGYVNQRFYFGSTLFSLLACDEFNNLKIHDHLAHFLLAYGYVPGPHSALKDVFKLPPGTFIQTNLSNLSNPLRPKRYWHPSLALTKRPSLIRTSEEALEHLDPLLKSVVQRQTISDVSLGAFLSGGIDSSLVVSMMQNASNTQVKTYSIGFTDQGYNEAEDAKKVAQHLGTDHTEFYVNDKTSFDIATHLTEVYDEPFADFSQIPTTIICKLARQHVTVALTGDGGDETFLGYSRYFIFRDANRLLGKVPIPLLNTGFQAIQLIPESALKGTYRLLFGKPYKAKGDLKSRIQKLSHSYGRNPELGLYHYFVSDSANLSLLPTDRMCKSHWHDTSWQGKLNGASIESLGYRDTLAYMPDDIFVKVDRASMSQSLETRAPLVDRDILEFAWSLDESIKIPNMNPKYLLKNTLYKYVPKPLVDRPKQGFSLPIGKWLRHELKDFSSQTIASCRQDMAHLVDFKKVDAMLAEHHSGYADHGLPIWRLTMLTQWVQQHRTKLSLS